MTDEPRRALIEIVERYGAGLVEDARRTEALLRDFCPERRRETFALVSAIRERVPADLLTSKDSTPRDVLIPRLASRLSEDLGLAESAARWTVESWAVALGVVTEAELPAPAAAPPTVAPMPASPLSALPAAAPPVPGYPAAPPVMPVLTVSLDGSERYRSITAALQDAWPGQRIVVRAGIYRESLAVIRPVEILTASGERDVVIESSGPPCLVLQAETALVRGLTLVQRAANATQAAWALDVPAGRPVIEDCRLSINASAPWSAAIFVHGQTADPRIRRCAIQDVPCSAVLVSDRARGVLEDCVISGAGNPAAPAVAGITGAQTALLRCRVEHAGGAGVWCGDGGAVQLDGCDLSGCAGAGIEVSGGAPVVRRSRILQPRGAGVWVTNGGRGQFEDCEVVGTGGPGVWLASGATPTFRRCGVRDSGADGISVSDNAWGTFEDCQVQGPAQSALQVARGGNPKLRRCRLSGARAHAGALIWAGAQVSFEECEITENTGSGVEVRQGAGALLRRCTVRSNGAYGVLVAETSSATVERCTLLPNPHGSWYIQPGCQVRRTANIE